jgi:putative membrane protein
VQIQTASGQSGAELTVEGLADYEAVRDELYRRMRGARGEHATSPLPAGTASTAHGVVTDQGEIVAALNEAVAELRALRAELGRAGRV